jgi:hypothetical protein
MRGSPTGKSPKSLSSPFCKNILLFRNRKSVYIKRRLVPHEGRLAIVTDAGRDAVDADGASDESTGCGRRRRVVLTLRCWCQVGGVSASDGGKKADHRGDHVISRKPLRGECRVIPV